jgi:hypothetical protein
LKEKLSLCSTAVGSLPHNNVEEALDLIFDTFEKIPFWPQLSKINPKEDMIIQIFENIPGLKLDEDGNKLFFDTEDEEFYLQLEEFFEDFEKITSQNQLDLLEKYAISEDLTSSFRPYLKKLAQSKPAFAKGQVTGPFSWGVSIIDGEKKAAFYDETLRDIIIKALTLKALWQVVEIKKASAGTTPIIFLDEPTLSQFGTSAFLTVDRDDIIGSINQIAEILEKNGALIGVHCCGKTNWSLLSDSNIKIINFDGFFFAEVCLLIQRINSFLEQGDSLPGMIPTWIGCFESAMWILWSQKFEEAKRFFNQKRIKEELRSSKVSSPILRCGSLNEGRAKKAIKLTKELSERLKENYKGAI